MNLSAWADDHHGLMCKKQYHTLMCSKSLKSGLCLGDWGEHAAGVHAHSVRAAECMDTGAHAMGLNMSKLVGGGM